MRLLLLVILPLFFFNVVVYAKCGESKQLSGFSRFIDSSKVSVSIYEAVSYGNAKNYYFKLSDSCVTLPYEFEEKSFKELMENVLAYELSTELDVKLAVNDVLNLFGAVNKITFIRVHKMEEKKWKVQLALEMITWDGYMVETNTTYVEFDIQNYGKVTSMLVMKLFQNK